ncbi:MAG: hypothetical protein GXP49_04000, partial [Deltaproteobacteria bacterium]|nr:hypothetical protein [Deltaproteobacteria bacterium]
MRKRIFLSILIPFAFVSGMARGQNAWDLTTAPDAYIVMGEPSPLTVTAVNTGTGDPISYIQLWFRGAHAIQSVDTPAGWGVVDIFPISFLNLIRVRLAVNDCASGAQISPGQSADFTLHLTWTTGSTDSLKSVWSSTADDSTCGTGTFSQTPTPSFLVRGLYTSMTATPVTLGVGGQVEVKLSVKNDSTADKTVTPSNLKESTPGVVSCSATPASQDIPSGGIADFIWNCQAVSSGQVDLSADANGVDVTGAEASTQVLVGDLTATMSLYPEAVVSGENVEATMVVKNNGQTIVRDIQPPADVDVGLGSAVCTLVSGPVPASIASLSPGQSESVSWTYQVTGSLGQDFAFQGQATAESGTMTTNTATSGYGVIAEYVAEADPSSVYTGGTDQVIAFTVYNNGGYNVNHVSISPDVKTGWSIDTTSENWARLDLSGWTPSGSDGFFGLFMDFDAPSQAEEIPPGGNKIFTVVMATTPGSETVTNFRVDISTVGGNNGSAYAVVNVVNEPGGAERPPDVSYFTGTTGSGGNVDLYWGNPAVHNGVLVLRSEVPPVQWCTSATPVDGVSYSIGQKVCDSPDPVVEVAYYDADSYATSFSDTSTVPDARTYYYRVYNHDSNLLYSPGLVPSSSGITLRPTDCISPHPCWA